MRLSLLLALVSGCDRAPPTPEAYTLPAGYTGWVLIDYGVSGAPPLEVTDGRRQLRVPSSGTLQTSSPLEVGRVDQRFTQGGASLPFMPDLTAPAGDAVVCCLYTGTQQAGQQQRTYATFYVGRGPAAEPPLSELLAR